MNKLVQLLKLARARRVQHAGLSKSAIVIGAPFSSLTARSASAAAGGRLTETPNEYTRDDQRFLNQLVSRMSRSRARIVDARRQGRLEARNP